MKVYMLLVRMYISFILRDLLPTSYVKNKRTLSKFENKFLEMLYYGVRIQTNSQS